MYAEYVLSTVSGKYDVSVSSNRSSKDIIVSPKELLLVTAIVNNNSNNDSYLIKDHKPLEVDTELALGQSMPFSLQG